jgi:oligoendopeptidase F
MNSKNQSTAKRSESKAQAKHEKLPVWNLKDFYPEINSPEVVRDIAQAIDSAKNFQDKYKGKLANLTASELGQAIEQYEEISELSQKIGSYAYLVYATDVTDPTNTTFFQNTSEKLNQASSELIFFSLELNLISDEQLNEKYKQAAQLAKYKPWIRDIRAFKPYQLSEDLEKLLHEKSVAGNQAWVRLFDETLASLSFKIGNKKLSCDEALNLLSSPKAKIRKAAALEIGRIFAENGRIFSMITNTLAKDKHVEDEWRGFESPISSRNVSNLVEDDVVEALISAVKTSFPKLSHRYYSWKGKQLGLKKMEYWDRNAPLPGDKDSPIPWPQARDLVLKSYSDFSPELGALGKKFFDNAWIDAELRPGKAGGAFSHPTVPSVHPYILQNYHGKSRDVMTLAHELGHGVHQLLAAEQGALMCDTPLTLAETASVFGEQLTFRAMLAEEKSEARRKLLIAGKVEDMLNTVVRQVAFCEFERVVHDERKSGEISEKRLGEIWMAIQKESLGSAFKFDKSYANYWAYIPHFIHSPFYVYAYAFGDLLVNSLYSVYLSGMPDFQKKYITLLKAGGTLRHKELLKPFGLDASKPEFWQKGLQVIEGFVDELVG